MTATSVADSGVSATASVTVALEGETQIVSYEINPNPVVRGDCVVVAWQAEFVGLRDGVPYCTLQRRFEGQPAEAFGVVPCVVSRTDEIDASITATYVDYRFSALRRSGEAYDTEDIRLDVVHGGVTLMPLTTGWAHSLALRSDGTVWSWGWNEYGQLGDGSTTGRLTPVQVSGLSDVTSIAAGVHHSLALRSDGTVWSWGGNGNGQLGDGTTTSRLTPVRVSDF